MRSLPLAGRRLEEFLSLARHDVPMRSAVLRTVVLASAVCAIAMSAGAPDSSSAPEGAGAAHVLGSIRVLGDSSSTIDGSGDAFTGLPRIARHVGS